MMNRSLLFIPGNNPGMIIKCECLGADMIILDLEDAVAISEKDAARHLIFCLLKYYRPKNIKIAVRINCLSSEFWEEDVRELAPMLGDGYIMLPKAESEQNIHTLEAAMDACCGGGARPRIIALIETAAGVENAWKIAGASPAMEALALGGEDYTSDIGCRRTEEGNELTYARFRVVNAAAAAGIRAVDTPYTDTENEENLAKESRYARSIGFTGKLAIHPSQVRIINECFSPTEEELNYAREVVALYTDALNRGLGAVALRGKMIDVPVFERAKRLLREEEK